MKTNNTNIANNIVAVNAVVAVAVATGNGSVMFKTESES